MHRQNDAEAVARVGSDLSGVKIREEFNHDEKVRSRMTPSGDNLEKIWVKYGSVSKRGKTCLMESILLKSILRFV